MSNKLAIVGIIVANRQKAAGTVNKILSDFGAVIVGRMGIHYKDKDVSVITITIDADEPVMNEVITKLSEIPEVQVKSLSMDF